MSITLYHHPFSRAATALWMLEEVGAPYELRFVDLLAGEQRSPAILALNPMGKLPILVDSTPQGEAVVTEAAAIGVWLADRHAPGRLAPLPDDPARATFLRWCFYSPSVIEPACMARANGWEFKPGQAGWGRWEDMLEALERGIGDGPWLLGDTFTMADVILGGTLRWMLQFKMIDARPALVAYADRLAARPALIAADARNAQVIAERGLGR
jgi:glutathione S-transferase